MKQHKTVYILGAGCSANYGYPLARDFLRDLEQYGHDLKKRDNCGHLTQSADSTVALMDQYRLPTIDRLVRRLEEEMWRQNRTLAPTDPNRIKNEQLELKQILDAKIVTAAMFLEQEANARETRLPGYQDFLSVLFDGRRRLDALAAATSRVLSFNYDRLFEIAFADYFGQSFCEDLYGKELLNSGWDGSDQQKINLVSDRFSFSKLHGSAGAWVGDRNGNAQYCWCRPSQGVEAIINDSYFWPRGQPSALNPADQKPLIVFPHEKDDSLSDSGSRFPHRKYVEAIWDHAARFVEDTSQIWVIGYSFDPNDRKSVLELLQKNKDCEIVVQNPQAEAICNEMELRYPDLSSRFKPLANPF